MGRKARFKRIKKSKTEFFGFVDEGSECPENVVQGIYEEDQREDMLENGEINHEEYGFMAGWEDAWDESHAE